MDDSGHLNVLDTSKTNDTTGPNTLVYWKSLTRCPHYHRNRRLNDRCLLLDRHLRRLSLSDALLNIWVLEPHYRYASTIVSELHHYIEPLCELAHSQSPRRHQPTSVNFLKLGWLQTDGNDQVLSGLRLLVTADIGPWCRQRQHSGHRKVILLFTTSARRAGRTASPRGGSDYRYTSSTASPAAGQLNSRLSAGADLGPDHNFTG